MIDILEFLSKHIFTIHLELGFVSTSQDVEHTPDNNVVDLRAYNELKNECPDFVEDLEFDDRLTPMFGFYTKQPKSK